ncbi:hypothetical protein LF1_59470 [Rubripirellula obstinata]|uniref:Uncharacterized protein n=1 Tax=Rubripirellula obstinata TaxID=406547 RepID=A0A5B1C975_9BACT|nr:hypothetical protein LF1_59470 [Rubripirellula obstinata]
MHTVIRLSRGHLLPASPCGAQPTHDQYRFAPQHSINTQVQTALRGINQRLNSNA